MFTSTIHMAFLGGDLLAGPLGCGTHYRGGSCKVGFMTSGFAIWLLSRGRREAEPEAHYFHNPHSFHQFRTPHLNPFFRLHLPSYTSFLPPYAAQPPVHYPPITSHVHLPHIHIIHPPPSPPPPPPPPTTTTTPPPTTTTPHLPTAKGCKNNQGSSVGCFSG